MYVTGSAETALPPIIIPSASTITRRFKFSLHALPIQKTFQAKLCILVAEYKPFVSELVLRLWRTVRGKSDQTNKPRSFVIRVIAIRPAKPIAISCKEPSSGVGVGE